MDSNHHIVDAEIETMDASDEIYSTYLDQIYRYVIYQVGEKATAEYLTQVIFREALRFSKRHEWDEPWFSLWLYRIAREQIEEYFHANPQERTVEIQLLAEDSDLEPEVDTNQTEQLCISAITSLPEQQRQVIVLKFINVLDNREAGHVMDITQGTIKMLQMKALIALQPKPSKDLKDTEITSDLAEVLDEYLTCIRNGVSIELCLNKYSYARGVLEPLLSTAVSISRAPKASPSEEFRNTFKPDSIADLPVASIEAKPEENRLPNREPSRLVAAKPKLVHTFSVHKRIATARSSLVHALSGKA